MKVKPVKQEAVYECDIILPNNERIPANDDLLQEQCKPQRAHVVKEKKSARKSKANLDQAEEEEEEEEGSVLSEGSLFYCTKDPNCTKTFLRHSNLENHILYGKCTFRMELSTKQQLRRNFAKKFSVNPENQVKSGSRAVINLVDLEEVEVPGILNVANLDPSDFKMGCALQAKRTNKRFSKELIKYLNDVFLEGERTKRKATAKQVEKDLRRARGEDGKLLFQCDEWLDELQIKSYFSRLASKKTSKTSKTITVTNEDIDEILDNARVQEVVNAQVEIMDVLEEEEEKNDFSKHPLKVP